MSANYSISEVAGIAANAAKDVTEEIVDAGRKFYCNLHQNHPAWTVARKFSNYSIILRSIDQMCAGENYVSPSPEPAPFSGGQCEGVSYYIIASCKMERWIWSRTSFQKVADVYPSVDTRQTGTLIVGAVSSVKFISTAPCPGEDPNRVECTYGGRGIFIEIVDSLGTKTARADAWTDAPFTGGVVGLSSNGFFRRDTIGEESYDVNTLDGSPDVCGDLPPSFPPEAPPGDNDLTGNVTVINNNNEENTYNVTVNRDSGDTISFPPVINVNNIGVGIDVTGISVGGVTINKRSGGGGGVLTPDNVEEKKPQVETKEPEEIEEESQEKTVENLVAIIVTVGSIPVNAKISSGNGAPNIIYAGWVEFKIEGNYFPRVFIDFNNNYFPAPEGADGYAVTLKKGYTASVEEVIEKVPEEEQ